MRILAHRGASGHAPENTLAAFDCALQMTADALETDIRLTRDGVPVLLHDARLDRTTTAAGAVSQMTWEEIRLLDAGIKFHQRFAGQRIPRLDDFLDRFASQIPLCLEIKIAAAIDPVIRLVQQTSGDFEFTSFEYAIALELRRRLPHASVGYLTRALGADLIHHARECGFSAICPPAAAVRPHLVAQAQAAGLAVRTWGVRSRSVLQHIFDSNVNGTTLNNLDWVLRHPTGIRIAPETE